MKECELIKGGHTLGLLAVNPFHKNSIFFSRDEGGEMRRCQWVNALQLECFSGSYSLSSPSFPTL